MIWIIVWIILCIKFVVLRYITMVVLMITPIGWPFDIGLLIYSFVKAFKEYLVNLETVYGNSEYKAARNIYLIQKYIIVISGILMLMFLVWLIIKSEILYYFLTSIF